MNPFKKAHFVINPAAGQPEAVLFTINKVLYTHDLEWDISLTQADGDGKRLARQAVDDGYDLIVAYGGDGTVKDVINGVMDSDIPIAILHGGTGNAMACELRIPNNLEAAVALIVDEHQLRGIDVGKVVCTEDKDKIGYFILRMSMGLQTKILESASRELKTQYGNLAYIIASLQELRTSENDVYQFTIDGEEVEGIGLTALIANSAHVGGQANFRFISTVDPADGHLDVLIMDNSFVGAIGVLGSALQIEGAGLSQHWRGEKITVHQPTDQLITLDGEIFGRTPAEVSIVKNAVKIIVPIEEDTEGDSD